MSKTAQIAIALIFALFFSLKSNAAGLEDRQGWAGGLVGITVPNADNTSSRMMYGITAGAKLGSELGLGGYFLTSNKKEDTAGDFNYQLYGIQLNYHFEGEAAGAWFGARLGISKVRAGLAEYSPANYGIVGGYDYALSDQISLGAEASYMGVASGTDNGQSVDSFGMINFLAALKFWF